MQCIMEVNNFEISRVVFMPNITTNHAITYTYYTPIPPYNGHLSTKANFFCPQGGRCGEVRLTFDCI